MSRKRDLIPYGMFDRESFGLEARNARILEKIYHRGHSQAWDGKEVLSSLIKEHGKPELPEATLGALGRVFSTIMWGELAAWKISAQLASALVPLEAKMAATSQAFDEARHFYVMHDYLEALGAMPERVDRPTELVLSSVMNAPCLGQKLLGMQLMIEPIALTLFHIVKEMKVEPVLTHLLPYYERDESRHVALGVKYLPVLMRSMSVREKIALWAFQVKVISLEVWGNRLLSADLVQLGVEPRDLVRVGMGKQLGALHETFAAMPGMSLGLLEMMSRYANALVEVSLPAAVDPRTSRERVQDAWDVIRNGYEVDDAPYAPEIHDEAVPLIREVQASLESVGPDASVMH